MELNKRRVLYLLILSVFILVSCGKDKKVGGEEVSKEIKVNEKIVSNLDEIKEKYKLGNGDEAPIMKTSFEFLEPNISVLEVDDKYLWGYRNKKDSGELFRSDDLGESWEKIYKFDKKIEGIHKTKTGVLLVSISNDRWSKDADCKIYSSVNNGEKFKRVLDIQSGAAITWNFASDDNGYVYISEYGYKKEDDNARRIYRSKENCNNWEIIYNPEKRKNHHNHIIHIDKNDNNIIYQSIGDMYKEVIVSKDRGENWEKLIDDINPTSIVDLGDELLFGLDNHPKSGILRYNKKTEELDFSLNTPEPYSGSIYDLLYEDGVIYAGLLSYAQESHTWPGTMYISKDKGDTWEEFAKWPKTGDESKSGIGFYNIVSKDGYGFINTQLPVYVDGKPSHYFGTLRFKLIDNKK